jgi:ADP-ribose pyrophosphatase YjhB (NUDIX family)
MSTTRKEKAMAKPRTTSATARLPEFPRPLTTVDLAIFTVRDGALQVLLVKRPDAPGEPHPGALALPGGFVDIEQDRDLEACARRKLKEKTGVASPYLEQLGSWGGKDRDPRGWSATHVYYALITDSGEPLAGANAPAAAWHPIAGEGVKAKLAFDHKELLAAAVNRLREFTLTELKRAFEIVLGRPVEKSAFRDRIKAGDFLEEVPRLRTGQQRPAQLYRVKKPGEVVFFPRTFSPRKE